MARRKHNCEGRYNIRLTAEDRAAWEGAAKTAGLPLSDWIRGVLANASGGGAVSSSIATITKTTYPKGRR